MSKCIFCFMLFISVNVLGQNPRRARFSHYEDTLQKLQPVAVKASVLPDSLNRFKKDTIDHFEPVDTVLKMMVEDTTVVVTEPTLVVAPEIRDTVKMKEPDVFEPLYKINLWTLSADEYWSTKFYAAIAFDEKMHFNAYRYAAWDRYNDNINPYALDVVPYFDRKLEPYLDKSEPSLSSTQWFLRDTVEQTEIEKQQTPIEIFLASRQELMEVDPSIATDCWDDLPDPPKNTDNNFLANVAHINLDYLIADREEIKTPEKLNNLVTKKSPWKVKGNTSVQLSQASSTYWEKGSADFFSLLGVGTITANYAKGNTSWENNGEVRLGAIRQGKEAEGFRKNEDRLRIGSKLGFRTKNHEKWYYTINMDFNSQLFNGYNYSSDGSSDLVSSFFTPAKTYISVGMDYKKSKDFSLFLSPLTYRLTSLRDTANISLSKYGVSDGKKSKQELGGYIRAQYKQNLAKNVSLLSKLYFFTDYTKFPLKLDLDWENIFTFQITHLLTANMSLHFVYDDDVLFDVTPDDQEETVYAKKLQFKELISIGFNYRF